MNQSMRPSLDPAPLPAPRTGRRRLAIGADHVGRPLKDALREALAAAGYDVVDVGSHSGERVDYPDFASQVTARVAAGSVDAGILVCGSGVGMQIAANRHPLVRAAVLHDLYTARFARAHNDANVACFGARLIAPELALDVLGCFLATPFDGGRHRARLDKIAPGPGSGPRDLDDVAHQSPGRP